MSFNKLQIFLKYFIRINYEILHETVTSYKTEIFKRWNKSKRQYLVYVIPECITMNAYHFDTK